KTIDCDFCCADAIVFDGFGFPIGDRRTSPAGGWSIVRGFSDNPKNPHLGEDLSISLVQDESTHRRTAGAPVSSVARGWVLFAGPVEGKLGETVFIEHLLSDGSYV